MAAHSDWYVSAQSSNSAAMVCILTVVFAPDWACSESIRDLCAEY